MMLLKILAAILAALVAPLGVAEGAADGIGVMDVPGIEERLDPAEDDSDAAFEGYVRQLFGVEKPRLLLRMARSLLSASLTGNDRAIYDVLKPEIARVAAGEREDTVIAVTSAQLGLEGKYYAEDLGVDSVLTADESRINPEASAAMFAMAKCNFSGIIGVLLRECPYELYWYDKVTGCVRESPKVSAGRINGRYYLFFKGDMTFSFPVAEGYGTGLYAMNTEAARAAVAASENAKAIVEACRDYPDYEKLAAYKDEICARAGYNASAMSPGAAYGDAWQMIWVFDDDSETKVVCEGYAKAFQYLCDASSFEGRVESAIVTGELDRVAHMWNVVRMPNHGNYLVDVTNCDNGGDTSLLFLKGYVSGDLSKGYALAANSARLYAYDAETRDMFSDDRLALSTRDYLEDTPSVAIDEDNFPDAAFRGFVSAQYDLNGDGWLSWAERRDASSLDVSGMGIGSLRGIERFEALDTLNARDNALTELDLRSCGWLLPVAAPENLDTGEGYATYSAGEDGWLSYDPGVRLIRSDAAGHAVLSLPSGTREIGDEAFAGAAVEVVALPEGVERIGERAFADCPNLAEVRVPTTVATDAIADDAFAGSIGASLVTSDPKLRAWALEHGLLWLPEE